MEASQISEPQRDEETDNDLEALRVHLNLDDCMAWEYYMFLQRLLDECLGPNYEPRRIVVDLKTGSSILLPVIGAGPPPAKARFADISLEFEGSIVHLRFNTYNLYLTGFKKNSMDGWYEMGLDDTFIISNSKRLPFNGDYGSLFTRRESWGNTRFGLQELKLAVQKLCSVSKLSNPAEFEKVSRKSLLTCVVMIAESCRFRPVRLHFFNMIMKDKKNNVDKSERPVHDTQLVPLKLHSLFDHWKKISTKLLRQDYSDSLLVPDSGAQTMKDFANLLSVLKG